MLFTAERFYGDADSIFQLDLVPTHTAKGTKTWSNDRYKSNLSFHYTSAEPQADCLHAMLHKCSNLGKRSSLKAT